MPEFGIVEAVEREILKEQCCFTSAIWIASALKNSADKLAITSKPLSLLCCHEFHVKISYLSNVMQDMENVKAVRREILTRFNFFTSGIWIAQ